MNIGQTAVKVLSKTMGAMALSAVTIDALKMGKIRAEEHIKEGESNDTLRSYIGNSKMDFPSPMYAKMKERMSILYPHGLMNAIHAVKGAIVGFASGIMHHADVIGSSIFVLCAKKKAGQIASALFLGGVCAYNFIKNGTGLTERKKDLEEM